MKRKLAFLLLSSLHYRNRNLKAGDRGFSIIEVIAAMVILSLFTLISLSTVVVGLQSKLKAKLNNEAPLIIQQDLEKVRYAATQLGINTVTGLSTAPANGIGAISGTTLNLTINVANNGNNYLSTATINKQLIIGSEATAYTLRTVPSTAGATSLAVTVDLSKIYKRFSTLSSALPLSTSSISSIPVADASAFQAGDRIVIGPSSGGTVIFSVIVSSVDKTSSPNTVSFTPLTPTAAQTYAVGTRVTALPRVGDVIPALCTSIATTSIDSLKNVVIVPTPTPSISTPTPSPLTIVTESTVSRNDRTYQVKRTTTAAPEPTLATPSALSTTRVQMVYGVKDTTFSTSDLASLTTEVIPSVTFLCP